MTTSPDQVLNQHWAAKMLKPLALIIASIPLCSNSSVMWKFKNIFFFIFPETQVLWQPDSQQQTNGPVMVAVASSCQASRFLFFQACLSLWGLNHGKTIHVPWWSSSAGWSDVPHHEPPSHGPQSQYHAMASGGWRTCQWNLPRCTRQQSSLISLPETEAIWPQGRPHLW